ncbi:MAG: hypothetical protein KKE44_18440 [Proteobacteria bacterium]|nr:hypothetical protein [Pseudomonadota bacterium]MBU1584713.1 hypothetical protein [Pseudomonadota bacterium]MBU2452592.1 hypothetical protein [Pseudomonadota bacterium]MBU2627174.1 hypothetical protein [Pseudomonadota bacterium]
MKKIMAVSGLILFCFLTTTPQAREISWKKYALHLVDDWQATDLENNTSSVLTIVSEQQGIYATIKISDKPLNRKPVADYAAWLKNYAEEWTSFKFSNSSMVEKSTVTVLGHKNCPMAAGQNNATFICQFLPLVDGYAYSIIVNATPYSDQTLPPFILSMLERMVFDHHGGIESPVIETTDTNENIIDSTKDTRQPPPSLGEQFSESELKALHSHVISVSDFFEKGDKQGLANTLLPGPQTVIKNAIENSSPEELARFGNALKSRRVTAMGRDLVEYEIIDGAQKYAVSFILMDGKWYLYHF